MNEKAIGAIASALSLDVSEFTAALKDGEKWLADEALADKIGELVASQVKAAKEAQHKRGQRETWTAVEKRLKAQGFDNAEKLQNVAMMDAFFETYVADKAPEGKTPEQFTKEELAKLPMVKSLMQEAKAEAGKQYDALKTEYEAAKNDWKVQRVQDVAKRKMVEHLEEAKILLDLPGSTVNKAKRVEAISAMLNWAEVGVTDKGEVVFVDPDGNVKTDDFGKALDFKKQVVSIGTDLFGVLKQDPTKSGAQPSGSGAAGASGGGNGQHVQKYNFASQKDFDSAYIGTSDNSERFQMLKDWQYQQQQAAAGK